MASMFWGRNRVIIPAMVAAVLAAVVVVVILMVTGGSETPPETSSETASIAVQTKGPQLTPSKTIAPATQLPPAAADEFPWEADGLNDLERSAVESLEAIERSDPSTAEAVQQLPWLADELQLEERLALVSIKDIAAANPELARSVVGLP